jgi:hypothetical protein
MAEERSAILFSEMTPPLGREAEFNRWCEEEHIPIRMALSGFRSAQRYRDGQFEKYMAIYELSSLAALQTSAYLALKGSPSERSKVFLSSISGFTRYIAQLIATRTAIPNDALLNEAVLYAVFFDVPSDRLAEFDAWYEQDHVPTLMEDERWRGVRRFDIVDAIPHRFNRLALHHLADRCVLDGASRRKARQSPWRARLALESWFRGHYVVFDRLRDRFLGVG